jgi:glutaredoxin 3
MLNEAMKPVTLYTTDRCGLCVGAKKLLEKRRIAYKEVNLARDPDGRARLQQLTGMITFPQVVVGDRALGGFNELLAADREGRLADVLHNEAA